MPGTSESAFWEQDGQYLPFVAGAAVTLGTVVQFSATTAGEVVLATSATTTPVGVAIAGYRTARTATDNQVATGNLVTVATRGVVNLLVANGTVTQGELVQVYGAAGGVATLTITAAGGGDVHKIVGKAMSTAASAAYVRVKLMQG